MNSCPNCGAPLGIRVARPGVPQQCGSCGSVIGSPAQQPPQQVGAYPPATGAYPPSVGAYPPAAAAYPPAAGAYPPSAGAYPQTGGPQGPAPIYNRPPQASGGRNGLAIGIAIGSIVLMTVVAVVIYFVTRSSKASETDSWVDYTAQDGTFTARFPQVPVEGKIPRSVLPGRQAVSEAGLDRWEVAWVKVPRYMKVNLEEFKPDIEFSFRGKLTVWRANKFRGLDGRYGEIDDGKYKLQMFRGSTCLWILAASKEFEYFLEHFRPSEDERGIDTLELKVLPHKPAFEGVQVTAEPVFMVLGGVPPYEWTLHGDIPPGLVGSTGIDNTILHLEGTATKPGSYEFTVEVKDSDEGVAKSPTTFVVRAMPSSLGKLVCETVVVDSPEIGIRNGNEKVNASIGFLVKGTISMEPADPALKVRIASFEYPNMPKWLRATADTKNSRMHFEGTAEVAGVTAFDVVAVMRSAVRAGEFRETIRIELNCEPVPESQWPVTLGEVTPATVDARVNSSVWTELKLVVKEPDTWLKARPWAVSASWELDKAAIREALPPGLVLVEREAFAADTGLKQLVLQGKTTKAGTYEVTVKVKMKVKYIDEPYELTHVLKVVVR